jgi:hypothetical protein
MDWNVLLEALRFAGVSELRVVVLPGDIQGLRARASEELEPLLDLSDAIRNLARICEQLEPLEEERKEENKDDTNMEVDANEADDDMDEEEAIMEDAVLGDVIDVIMEDVEMG